MTRETDQRGRQIAVGAFILLGLAALLSGVLIGWRYMPGLLGEWVGFMVGVATTPFFLEAGCALLGLFLVLLINHWRDKREGDELVYLEQVAAPERLPDHAQWAIYRQEPLAGEVPALTAQAEGALAIGDLDSAAECFAAMSAEELNQPETIALRLRLARASGKQELAESLAAALDATRRRADG
jgi:hypothetical protein